MTKKILLCGATPGELSGGYNIEGVDVMVHGVGIFQTVYRMCEVLQDKDKKYDIVIQAGIAGEYNPDEPLLKTYLVSDTTFADCGTENENGEFQSIIGSMFLQANDKPFSNGYITNPLAKDIAEQTGLPLAVCNTVSRISTQRDYIQALMNKYPASIETMESAAMAYVCSMRNIPYAELRVTSNHTLPKAKEKWLLREALERLHDETKKICNKIAKNTLNY